VRIMLMQGRRKDFLAPVGSPGLFVSAQDLSFANGLFPERFEMDVDAVVISIRESGLCFVRDKTNCNAARDEDIGCVALSVLLIVAFH
jgi:hypothetical protein